MTAIAAANWPAAAHHDNGQSNRWVLRYAAPDTSERVEPEWRAPVGREARRAVHFNACYGRRENITPNDRECVMALMDTGNLLIWQALKLYLPVGTRLSSCYRPPQAQLNFIVQTARAKGYRFARNPALHDEASWSGALAFIRQKGFKVAAPGRSMHQRGLAYDLSGADLSKIETAVRKAVADGRIRLVAGSPSAILRETKNHCVHVEIEGGLLDFEPFEYA